VEEQPAVTDRHYNRDFTADSCVSKKTKGEKKMKTMRTMKFRVTSLLLGIGLTVLGPAAHLSYAQNHDLSPGGNLAVSQQFGLDQTDVFTVDESGTLNVISVQGGGTTWQDQYVGPANFEGGMPIVACQQFGLNQTDVFLVDENGTLDVFYVDGGGDWQGPQPLNTNAVGLFQPGAYLAVSQQMGADNQTDVFGVDKNGQLDVFYVNGAGQWQGPVKVPNAKFSAGVYTDIAATTQFGLNQTDVFVVNANDQLEVYWVDGAGDNWQGPEVMGPQIFYPFVTPIAVTQQFGFPSQTDVFLSDASGDLESFWVVGAGKWQGPARIGPAGYFKTGFASGNYFAASQQFGLNQTDLFGNDINGNLDAFWIDGGPSWNGPAAISSSIGGAFAVGQQVGTSQTDLFSIDDNGGLDLLWIDVTGAWNGPNVIYQSWQP
jgi:hypothetical protein